MDIINYPENEKPKRWTHLTLALGNFDGLHRGHMKLVEQVQRRSNENGMAAAVLYFDPHPSRIVRPDKAPRILMTNAQKLEEFSRLGIDLAAIVRFTTGLSHWKPEKFVQEILVAWLRVSEVWVGANFLFGHNRAGNFSLLRSLGIKHGFKVEKIDSVRYKDFVVSSTRVRRLVDEGRVDEAGALLGHHYYIDGEVVVGAGRGRIQGCPTANLSTKNEVVPTNGVYAATIMLDGAIRPAVTNIGVRPTASESLKLIYSTTTATFTERPCALLLSRNYGTSKLFRPVARSSNKFLQIASEPGRCLTVFHCNILNSDYGWDCARFEVA